MGYVLRRGGVAIIVFLLAVTLNFAVIRAAPGEYRNHMADVQGVVISPQDRDEIRKSYGLDKPVPVQFLRYLEQTVQGNFGRSIVDAQPVRGKLWEAAKNSFSMVIIGVLAGMLIGIALGTIAGSSRSGWLDGGIVSVASLLYSLPAQWIGMVLL